MTEDNQASRVDVDAVLAVLERASKGPALWVEPVTGVNDGKRRDPYDAFRELLDREPYAASSQGEGGFAWPLVHGVSIPVEGQTVLDIPGGEHRVVAITGNGPTSEANARAIAAMFDPVHGWAATLRELRAVRAVESAIRRNAGEIDAEPGCGMTCPTCNGLGRVDESTDPDPAVVAPSSTRVAPQEHPVLTHRKMFATLVSMPPEGRPYKIGDLVCVDVPLNCTIESTHSEALTRMRVAAAILAERWEPLLALGVDMARGLGGDASTVDLVDEIVKCAKLLGDMPQKLDT